MLSIRGGTGLSRLDCFESAGQESIVTPFADEAVSINLYKHGVTTLAFLPRHGSDHVVPPHRINYRANIWALHQLTVNQILAIHAVGGIHQDLAPGTFAVPNQLIDYTSGRHSTFFEDDLAAVTHIDFTVPYDEDLRRHLLSSAQVVNAQNKTQRVVMDGGVDGCTQGPRLETAAEIKRLRRDGCDMVGMTGMPEAALARELQMAYASLAFSVNCAAGLSDELITLDNIHRVLDDGMGFVSSLLRQLVTGQIK